MKKKYTKLIFSLLALFTLLLLSPQSFAVHKKYQPFITHKRVLNSFIRLQPFIFKASPDISLYTSFKESKLLDYSLFFKTGYKPLEYKKFDPFIKPLRNKVKNKKDYDSVTYANYGYSFPSGYIYFNGGKLVIFSRRYYAHYQKKRTEYTIPRAYSRNKRYFGYENYFATCSLYIAPFKPLPCGIKSYMKQEEVLKILGPALLQTKEALVYKMKLKEAREIFIYLIFNKEGKLLSIVFDNIHLKIYIYEE